MWIRFGKNLAYGNCFNKFEHNGVKYGYKLCDYPKGAVTQLTEVPNLPDVWVACLEDSDEDETYFYCSLFVYNLAAEDRRFHCWLLGDSQEPSWTFEEPHTVIFKRGNGDIEYVNIKETLRIVDTLKSQLDSSN